MLYGLIDCNNFFVSCERAFNPSLWGKPVVVLSNNDGCVISRSYEAKDLGIPMGCPAFKIKEYTDPNKVVMLSGRHQLYGDLSNRIMSIVGKAVEGVEVYSIDEAFFRLPYNDNEKNTQLALSLTRKIFKYVGVTVSIGIAPTRTLAKVASHIAKEKRSCTENVFCLTLKEQIEGILMTTPVSDIWGIGRQTAKSLNAQHIFSAWDFICMPPAFVKKKYTITGLRTQNELKGIDNTSSNPASVAHQSIMTSRSFGQTIHDKKDINDAIVSFASNCAKRLRSQKSVASSVTVFIRTDRFNDKEPFYSNSCELKLPTPTSSSLEITKYAVLALGHIYRHGPKYKKAGVLISGIRPAKGIEQDLFAEANLSKHNKLMQVLDEINNKTGSLKVHIAADHKAHKWKPSSKFSLLGNSSLHIFSAMVQPKDIDTNNIDID